MSKTANLALKDNTLLNLPTMSTIGTPGSNGYVQIWRVGTLCIVSGFIGTAGVDRPAVEFGGVTFTAPPIVQVTPVAAPPVGTHEVRVDETEDHRFYAVRTSGTAFNWTAIGEYESEAF